MATLLTGTFTPTGTMDQSGSRSSTAAGYSPSKSFIINPSNTNTAGSDPHGGPDLPTAILVAAAIIAGTFVMLVVFIVCTLFFFAQRRMKSQCHNLGRRRDSGDLQSTQFSNPQAVQPPEYSQVNKSTAHSASNHSIHKPRVSSCTCSSGNTALHYAAHQLPEPHEILAYHDVDLLEKFRPLPPPPSITSGFSSPTLYDIPEATFDKDGNMVQGKNNGARYGSGVIPRRDGQNYYDQVEMTHDNSRGRSQSMRRFPSYEERERNRSVSFVQRASSVRSSPGRVTPQYDHIYQEQLEPSMLRDTGGTPDRTIRPLPYGPIYDVPKPLKNTEDPLEILPDHIIEIRELGIGRFGTVSLAATVGLSFKDIRLGENEDKNRSLLVAIKKLNSDGGESLRESFEQEIKYMSRLHHPNVIHLLGVCMIGEPFIMMEYMENGDLNEFLQKQVLVDDSVNLLRENEVSPLVLLYMTVQIASGMRYLASKRVVHRDLATRNCLVGRDFVVKVSDFGMSRNLYDSFYYHVHGKLILPIRWMAYESFYGKFSVKSDVWAFGITMWEIYTLAQREPYHEMTDEELITDAMKANARKRPNRPPIVPDQIYEVMQRCWVHDPLMRGDFEEVYSRLFLAYTRMCQLCN